MVKSLAEITGLMLTLAMLVACRPAPEVQQTPLPVSSPTWQGGPTTASEMDDSPSVMYSLDADVALQGANDREATPALLLRCREGKLAAFVRTHMPPDPSIELGEPLAGLLAIRVRWDADEAGMEFWGPEADREAIFSPDARAFVVRLVTAQTLRVEFRPDRASSQVMRFSVGGFGTTRANALLEHCPKR